MKRTSPLHKWMVTIFLLLLISGLTHAEQPCRAADALLEATYIDDAKSTYVELLNGNEKPECASKGLLETRKAELALSAGLCATPEALLNAGYLDEAKAAYLEVIKSKVKNKPDCAFAGLAVVKLKQAEKWNDTISHARVLSSFGLHNEALKTLQDQLLLDDKMVVPEDLQYLSGGKLPFWRSIRRDLEFWARPILEIAMTIILLIVLFHLLRRRFSKRTLSIEEFDKGGLDGDFMGKDFSSFFRSQLNRIASGSNGGEISLVTGPIQTIDIPAEVEAIVPDLNQSWMSPITWVKAIPALFNWLFPPRTVSLTGHLHAPGSRGVGTTAQLVGKNRILASYTFWQKDFDAASDPAIDNVAEGLNQLAEYAAIWLLFEMATLFESGLTLLGTANWQSYAYFRAGFRAENQGREEAAKILYIRALRLDPRLHGARVNLAVWYLRKEMPKVALEQLTRAKADCVKAKDGDQDPTLYSAIYNIGALSYDEGDIEGAKKQTADLLNQIEETLKKIEDKKEKDYKDPALKHHLVSIRPVANTMLGGLLVELGEKGGRKYIEDETEKSSVYPRLQYNLACGYSVLAKNEPQDTPDGVARRESDLEKSLLHLERSFQINANIVNQVKNDRSLKYVSEAKATEFQALLDAYGSPSPMVVNSPPELLLAKLENISDENALKLQGENIQTTDELLQSTLNPQARKALAAKLNVTEQLVTRWAHDMDLLRIVGLGSPHLKLLALARVHSLTELKASNPDVLKALLDDLSAEQGEIEIPDISMVNAWINDARSYTKPKVL